MHFERWDYNTIYIFRGLILARKLTERARECERGKQTNVEREIECVEKG